jgi:uncharacterized membrane protein
MTRLNWISLVVLAAMVALALWFYPSLPDPVPTHWNLNGEVDGWTAKPWGVWLWPAMMMPLFGLFIAIPVISPKGFRLDKARRVYDIVIFVVMAFMLVIQLVSYLNAQGRGPDITTIMPGLIGFLFIVLGNYMGKFPKNFFVGIRTPWTLASDEVWNRTHRLGGWMFMVAGGVMLISAFTGLSWVVLATVIGLAAFVPMIYSLVLYKKLHGFDGGED